jgi:hypothetical protein
MPGKTIGIEMNLGYAGSFARTPDCIIMNRKAKTTDIPFGAPVVLNGSDNTYSAFGATNTAAQFVGVAVREVKQAVNYASQNNVYYPAGEPCDVIERGNVVVKCGKGTPTAGGAVYIRVTANASYPDQAVGSFEAEADSNKTVKLLNAVWATGKIDGNKMCELAIYRSAAVSAVTDVASDLATHVADKTNPHEVTTAQAAAAS